jgi:type IV pilus assembly protein PilP
VISTMLRQSAIRTVIMHSPRLLAAAGLLAFLAGCGGGGMDDLRRYVDETKALPHGEIEPIPPIQTFPSFAYSAQELRDPFEPVVSPEPERGGPEEGGIRPDFDRVREELEAHPLDALRMVGTVEQFGTIWGLVRTTDGTIHRVQPGNYMGQNHGQVVRITEETIDVREIVQEGSNRWRERSAALALNE